MKAPAAIGPRRCKYVVVTKELMARVMFTSDHLHLPSDVRLVGYEKQPMNDDFFAMVYSDTFDYVPVGKQFPVVTVNFIKRGNQSEPARVVGATQESKGEEGQGR